MTVGVWTRKIKISSDSGPRLGSVFPASGLEPVGKNPNRCCCLNSSELWDIKNVHMVLCLGPGENESIRQKIFEKINDVDRNLFNHANYSSYIKPFSDDYRHIYFGKNILDEEDLDKWDDNERSYVREKVEHWVRGFAENDFPKLNDIIVNCFKEHEGELTLTA